VSKDVYIYDTTLRDGEQAEGITFSLQDKVRIALRLDEFGIDYIEGGWPGSNPKAIEFFKHFEQARLKSAKLAAFGSTRRKDTRAHDDPNIGALLAAKTAVVTIFGKSWDFHVHDALRVSLDENLLMIHDSVSYLKKKGKEVVYDAEHFFDGYKHNREYALKTLGAAIEAGADSIVLCDTNGGTVTTDVAAIISEVKPYLHMAFGIHAHNDAGLAVANSLMAVHLGANHVQGTINGFGERCGNADLIQIIPSLVFKYQKRCVARTAVRELTEVSHFVSEIANIPPDPRHPYVGRSVFTHKAGIHVSAILRNPETYEHIKPEWVGNERRVLVSELSGKSNVDFKAKQLGIDIAQAGDAARALVAEIKEMENEGYQFEAADGSFEVLLKKALGKHKIFFELAGFRVIIEKRGPEQPCLAEATIKLYVNGALKHTAAEGEGPVNALDKALRKALSDSYPQLKNIHLSDFKVRVIDPKEGTAAKVRVLVETTDGKKEWSTVGVSENIIEASWRALVDSVEYKLLKDAERRVRKQRNK
jgi:2-isopropylmalate synthase